MLLLFLDLHAYGNLKTTTTKSSPNHSSLDGQVVAVSLLMNYTVLIRNKENADFTKFTKKGESHKAVPFSRVEGFLLVEHDLPPSSHERYQPPWGIWGFPGITAHLKTREINSLEKMDVSEDRRCGVVSQ